MKVITRKEAIALGLRRYFTGAPCVNGHLVEKYTNHGSCVECVNIKDRNRRARKKANRNPSCDFVLSTEFEMNIRRKEIIPGATVYLMGRRAA